MIGKWEKKSRAILHQWLPTALVGVVLSYHPLPSNSTPKLVVFLHQLFQQDPDIRIWTSPHSHPRRHRGWIRLIHFQHRFHQRSLSIWEHATTKCVGYTCTGLSNVREWPLDGSAEAQSLSQEISQSFRLQLKWLSIPFLGWAADAKQFACCYDHRLHIEEQFLNFKAMLPVIPADDLIQLRLNMLLCYLNGVEFRDEEKDKMDWNFDLQLWQDRQECWRKGWGAVISGHQIAVYERGLSKRPVPYPRDFLEWQRRWGAITSRQYLHVMPHCDGYLVVSRYELSDPEGGVMYDIETGTDQIFALSFADLLPWVFGNSAYQDCFCTVDVVRLVCFLMQ